MIKHGNRKPKDTFSWEIKLNFYVFVRKEGMDINLMNFAISLNVNVKVLKWHRVSEETVANGKTVWRTD